VIERPRNYGSIPGMDDRYLFMILMLAVQTNLASSSSDIEGLFPGR
jgi:hypothetical protein